MATENDRLEHARHNDKALKHFDKDPNFLDWVITVAFYSALHYVKFKLFPFEETLENGVIHKHNNFDAYYRFYKYKKLNKHELLLELVTLNLSEIAIEYNQLKDMCWTARYIDYKTDRTLSNLAKQHQKAIKDFCEPKI